jgi:hypothetical protein
MHKKSPERTLRGRRRAHCWRGPWRRRTSAGRPWADPTCGTFGRRCTSGGRYASQSRRPSTSRRVRARARCTLLGDARAEVFVILTHRHRDKRAGGRRTEETVGKAGGRLLVADEADAHRLAPVGGREVELTGELAHLGLVKVAQREDGLHATEQRFEGCQRFAQKESWTGWRTRTDPAQCAAVDGAQEVALVLDRVGTSPELGRLTRLPRVGQADLGIVAGREQAAGRGRGGACRGLLRCRREHAVEESAELYLTITGASKGSRRTRRAMSVSGVLLLH